MCLIVQVRSMLKTKLNSHDLFDGVLSMKKTIYDNDITDRTSGVYNEIEKEFFIIDRIGCDLSRKAD